MLLLAERLKQMPVMSLQTGAEIAQATEAIVDPGVLEVIAYRVTGPRVEDTATLLLTRDIREVSDIGFIVDSSDELMLEDDLLKVQKIIKLHFQLVGMDVIDDQKHRLGKIYDYSIDPMTFTIHQLYVKRSLLKSLRTSDLIVNRKQIAEINDKAVIVKSATLEERPTPAKMAESFVNPFKGTSSRPANNREPSD